MRGSVRIPFRATSSATVSVAVHAAVLAALLMAARWQPRVVTRIPQPGTLVGTRILPVYSLGGLTGTIVPSRSLPTPRTPTPPTPRPKIAPRPQPAPTGAATSPGAGSSGDSALGNDNINIALVRNHPNPVPDLSVLPHGAAGDVVLDIVIDAKGNISGIKLDHGLNPDIDKSVIATVQQWSFAPATRNGEPVASEQELLFHYIRS